MSGSDAIKFRNLIYKTPLAARPNIDPIPNT